MNEEEQFVNIDLTDDNICSVCKLGTDKETLSFCHVCFELNIEGKDSTDLFYGMLYSATLPWTGFKVKRKFLEWLEMVPSMKCGKKSVCGNETEVSTDTNLNFFSPSINPIFANITMTIDW